MTTLNKAFFLLVIATSGAFAASISTPASSDMEIISGLLQEYQDKHNGQLPQTWDLLEPKNASFVTFELLKQNLGGSIDGKILLLNVSVEMVNAKPGQVFDGGTIVAVTVSEISEDRRKSTGRYVSWRDNNGRIRTDWLDEPVVAQQFQKAGISVPSGPLQVQPPTRDTSLDEEVSKYAIENFKDPKAPTKEEVAKMQQVFREKYGHKPVSDAQSGLPSQAPATAQLIPKPAESAKPTPIIEARETRPPFPVVPVAIIAVVIVGVTVLFFLRRKSG